MTRFMLQAVLAAAILTPGLGPAAARASSLGPDSWASYERRFYNPSPPDPPYQQTFFSSAEGGGTAREVSTNGDGRYDPTRPTWDIQSGATFSLATWTPGDPVLLSLTATFAFGYFDVPGVYATLFGTDGPLVESDFQGHHDPEGLVFFSFPQIQGDPPATRTEDISSFIEEIAGRYSRLGIVFSSNSANLGNIVDFDVRLVSDGFVPEPSSIVMGATAVLAGLAAIRRRGPRATRRCERRRES